MASTCVELRGETLLLDPLAPSEAAAEFWKRLDARPPTAVVVLKPDHVRDVDLFVRRYNARAFGPRLFFREDIPKTDLQFIEPGSHLPGGLIALYDGRGRNETPLWLPEQRTIVFADALTAPDGEGTDAVEAPRRRRERVIAWTLAAVAIRELARRLTTASSRRISRDAHHVAAFWVRIRWAIAARSVAISRSRST